MNHESFNRFPKGKTGLDKGISWLTFCKNGSNGRILGKTGKVDLIPTLGLGYSQSVWLVV